MESTLNKRLYAEFFGTFMLVFAGTAAIITNDSMNSVIGHNGICLTFGLIVLTVVYTYGDISGAHINPAVTFGFWLANRFPLKEVIPYIAAQLCGAITASFSLSLLLTEHKTMGATIPSNNLWQSFIFEVILTWWLMTVILELSEGAKEKGIVAGIIIGAVVTLEGIFAGPISGASMNPARSFGPALVSGQLEYIWIYLIAPLLGSLSSVLTYSLIHGSTLSFIPRSNSSK